ncbi:MAG: hypothetical protein ACLSD6_08545 [Clostridium sp.]
MQVNILSRYGIKNYSRSRTGLSFANGNTRDFRYENLVIINRYHGVCQKTKQGQIYYETKIHWNGDLLVGRYENEMKLPLPITKQLPLFKKRLSGKIIRLIILKNFPIRIPLPLSGSGYFRQNQSS